MTIITQDEVFVNYNHVIKIAIYGDAVEDDEGYVVDVAVIKAHLDTGKKAVLGVYAEADQLDEVLKDFTHWLSESDSFKQVFKMPVPKLYVEDSDTAESKNTEPGDDKPNE